MVKQAKAKEPTETAVKFKTAPARVIYEPKLVEPDIFQGSSKYVINVQLDASDSAAQETLSFIEAVNTENNSTLTKAFTRAQKINPVTEERVETGNVNLRFKSSFQPKVYDTEGNPLSLDTIEKGDMVSVIGEIYIWPIPATKTKATTLRMNKIILEKKGGAQTTPQGSKPANEEPAF